MSNNDIIPQYNTVRQNYSAEEKILLGELEKQGVIIIDIRGRDLSFVMQN
jgi:hypothetical protein